MIEWGLAILAVSFLAIVAVNAIGFLRAATASSAEPEQVSVLIPARNEEHTLEACLESVLKQGDVVAEVLIYDDESDDHTREVAAQWTKRDRRVRLLETVPLALGWYGKPHACYRLATAARGRWLLFLDADARLMPGAIASLLATARRHGATLVSAWPAIEMLSASEQALLPMLNFYVMTLFPSPLQIWSNHPRYALAHGACMLCERETYHRIGGHQLVRQELFEDTALARQWRACGERGLCCDGLGLVRVRMYRSVKEIWLGFQKNFYPGFRKRWLFPLILAVHILVFTAPFAWIVLAPSAASAVATGAVIGARLLLALRFQQPLWSIILHPFAELFTIAVGIASWWYWQHHRGVVWKNRRYRPRSTTVASE
jgi:chlorobactene glucosyltransferase